MDEWFTREWREERGDQRVFRTDVVQRLAEVESRLTALETRNTVLDGVDADTHTRWPAWIGVCLAVCALAVSVFLR